MENLNLICDYITKKTNHAIIINGKYGVGKTYFCKEILMPEIEKISTKEDDRQKYKAIHISLYGLKTIAELESKIQEALSSIKMGLKIYFGSKKILTDSETKSLVKDVIKIPILGSILYWIFMFILNRIKNMEISKQYYAVIIIDDLDRKDITLSLDSVIGYMNNLVENQDYKVIFIADEDKLDKPTTVVTQQTPYITLKEKTIGLTINFKPSPNDNLDSILKKIKEANPTYANFLESKKNTMIDILTINHNNLRSILFFIEYFQSVYSQLILNDIKQDMVQKIFYFAIVIAFEYRLGTFEGSDKNAIGAKLKHQLLWQDMLKNFDENKNNENKDSVTVLLIKYNKYGRLAFFESIFYYMILETALDISLLKAETTDNQPEHISAASQLKDAQRNNISNESFIAYKDKVLSFVSEGKYIIEDYQYIYIWIAKYQNICDIDIEKTYNIIHSGIEKYMERSDVLNGNRILGKIEEIQEDKIKKLILGTEKYKNTFWEYWQKIHFFSQEQLDILKQKLSKIHLPTKQLFFESINTDEFNSILNKIDDNMLFWGDISSEEIQNAINKMTNEEIAIFAEYFENRTSIVKATQKDDNTFLIKLLSFLDPTSPSRKEANFRNQTLNELYEIVNNKINSELREG